LYRNLSQNRVSEFKPAGVSEFKPAGVSEFKPAGVSEFKPANQAIHYAPGWTPAWTSKLRTTTSKLLIADHLNRTAESEFGIPSSLQFPEMKSNTLLEL